MAEITVLQPTAADVLLAAADHLQQNYTAPRITRPYVIAAIRTSLATLARTCPPGQSKTPQRQKQCHHRMSHNAHLRTQT